MIDSSSKINSNSPKNWFQSTIGLKASNLVLLHGWGTTWQSLSPLVEIFKNKYNVYALDLPSAKYSVLTIDDYVVFVLNFIKDNQIDNPIIIGHSLGGAIASKIAAQHPKKIRAIILLAAASIRHQLPKNWLILQKLIYPVKPLLRLFRKQILKITKLDATDYLELSTNEEKQTFRNLLKTDLSSLLPKINCPTLILWGEKDESTRLEDGKKIHELIKHSIFKSYPNCGHLFYLDYPQDVSDTIITFINNAT